MSDTPAPADRVAAYLAEVRARAKPHGSWKEQATSARDVPRLRAALEAVLKLTQDEDGNDRHSDRMLRMGDVRGAISRALTGEEGTDAT